MCKPILRPFVAIAAAVLLVLSCVLCGCIKKDDVIIKETKNRNSEKVVLSFFGYKAEALNLTAIEAAINGFIQENPDVEITYEPIKGEEYWEAFDKRDKTGQLDDVFMMHHDHVLSLSKENKLADLSDIPGIENFSEEARAQFTNGDGSIYFLPTQNSTYNLYINTDLLKEHGQQVPTSWNEFKAVCDYFVSHDIVPIVANNRNSLTTLMLGKGLFDLYQLPDDQIEAKLAEFNENSALYAQAIAPGVEMVGDMIEWGWIDIEEAQETDQTSVDLEIFTEGERPFMITGGWATPRVDAKDPGFTYGVYPYPILDDGSVLLGQADTCISVNANSKHLEEAKAFVAYLVKPEVMWDYCDTQASFTPLKDSAAPTEQALAPSVNYLNNGRIVMRSDYRLNLPTEAALSAAAKTLLKGGTVQEAQAAFLKALQS